jgi:hypothetical protein
MAPWGPGDRRFGLVDALRQFDRNLAFWGFLRTFLAQASASKEIAESGAVRAAGPEKKSGRTG